MTQRGRDPGEPEPPFSYSWTAVGLRGTEVRAAGTLDADAGPQLAHALRAAGAAAPLILLDMGDVTSMDASGLRALRDATAAAREAGQQLVIVRLRADLVDLIDEQELLSEFHLVASEPTPPGPEALPVQGARPQNPVNAAIVPARVMAVADRRLWLQTDDGAVHRAWVPAASEEVESPGRPVELYVDERNAVNGWRDVISGFAVNQRLLPPGQLPADGRPMVCQGRCGRTWQAPAPDLLAEYDEHCLTCAGPLAAP